MISKPKKNFARLAVFGLAFFFASVSLFAEVIIILKDGGRIKGELVRESSKTVTISNVFGSLDIERANIKQIIKKGAKTVSYHMSYYSLRKKSWTKYATLASLAGGLFAVSLAADAGNPLVPLWTGIGSGVTILTFASLDYFKYGRLKKKKRRRLSLFLDGGVAPVNLAGGNGLSASGNPFLATREPGSERSGPRDVQFRLGSKIQF